MIPKIFFVWAKHFVRSFADLTANDRKIILTFDAYRARMSLRVLQLFFSNGIIAYALPAHSSSTLQPCDVGLFGKFKTALNYVISDSVQLDNITTMDMFNFCSLMRTAYEKAFSSEYIHASFLRSRMWPLEPDRFLQMPRPKNHDKLSALVTPEEL